MNTYKKKVNSISYTIRSMHEELKFEDFPSPRLSLATQFLQELAQKIFLQDPVTKQRFEARIFNSQLKGIPVIEVLPATAYFEHPTTQYSASIISARLDGPFM